MEYLLKGRKLNNVFFLLLFFFIIISYLFIYLFIFIFLFLFFFFFLTENPTHSTEPARPAIYLVLLKMNNAYLWCSTEHEKKTTVKPHKLEPRCLVYHG